MASDAYLKAARAANRQPVALLAIESVDAVKVESSSPSDWQAAKSSSNVNITSEAGTVFLATDNVDVYAGDYRDDYPVPGEDWIINNTEGTQPQRYSYVYTAKNHHAIFVSASIILTNYGPDGSARATLQMSVDNGDTWSDLNSTTLAYYGEISIALEAEIDTGSIAPSFRIKVEADYRAGCQFRFMSWYTIHRTRYLAAGTFRTMTLDLGSIPSLDSRLELDDTMPSGTVIVYTARGSNDSNNWTDLGSVVDGATLAPYRYYDVLATFSTNTLDTPRLMSVRIVGGNSQYEYFSTHPDQPVQGVKPYITADGISSITNKIDLLKPASTGELTAKLFWRPQTSNMVATGYLRDKTVICKTGFVGLAEKDFEPYFTGSWYDYAADAGRKEISIKTRNVMEQFNRDVPDANYFLDANGNKVSSLTYTLQGNIIQVMLDLIDLLGIPDRLIDRTSFTALRDGAFLGDDWIVKRELSESVDAKEMMNELSVSSGVFVVPYSDGRLTALSFDAALTSAPAATLDAKHHSFKPIDGGQKDFATQILVYHQLLPGKSGSSTSDYGKQYLSVCSRDGKLVSELWGGQISTREWKDKWGMTAAAIRRLVDRWDSLFAEPRATVKVENLPPRFINVIEGMIVEVDNLQMPCPLASWEGYTVGKKFLVLSRTHDPLKGTIALELYGVGQTTYTADPDFPAYEVLSFFPSVNGLALSERLELRADGTLDDYLDISFNQPSSCSYGGAEVWYKVDSGDWQFSGRVEFGGPSGARVYSILVQENRIYTVAIVTVNAAGLRQSITQSPQATKETVGKLAPPADVIGFGIEIVRGQARLYWNPVPDVDVLGYEIQIGTTWDDAGNKVIVSDYLGTSYGWTPDRTGTISFLIKAKDTTRHYSETATQLLYVVLPPGAVTNLSQRVIDNLVELRWQTGTTGTFPIDGYDLYRGTDFATAAYLGRRYVTADLISELVSGTYKYWIVAVDTAGLESGESGIYVKVDGPPDYVLKNQLQLNWTTGTKVNAAVELGVLVIPISTTQTIDEAFTAGGWTTEQDAITAGADHNAEVVPATGSFSQILDIGTEVNSAKVTLTVTRNVIDGSPTVSCDLSASTSDSGPWISIASGAYEGMASNFRYVNVDLYATANGGFFNFLEGTLRVDVKELTRVVNVNITDTIGDGTETTFASIGINPAHVVGITLQAPYTGTTADPIDARAHYTGSSFKALAWDRNKVRCAVNGVTASIRYIP